MEQVFITDLDGTLLQSNGFLSIESEHILNLTATTPHKIGFATARGLTSAQKVVQQVQWNFPVLLNNGAVIYDWQTKKVLKINGIEDDYVAIALALGNQYGISPLVFTLNENFEEGIFFQENPSKGVQSFMEMRPYDPRFIGVEDIQHTANTWNTQSLVLMFIEDYETLVPLKLYIQEHYGTEINCLLLQDQYIPNQFVLELSSTKATKEYGIAYLQNRCDVQPEQLHLFGDNLNDLGMLTLPAHTYAVSNAHPVVLEKAQHKIPSNDQHGVAQTIQRIVLYQNRN